jgi:G:T-mismatch repair DNA endonuclease (very short patch repair protein)
MILEYFNVNLEWSGDVPKIKFVPLENKVISQVPRRPNSNMPYSPMEREYYKIFGDSPSLDTLYQERKSLAAKSSLIDWYLANFECDSDTQNKLYAYVARMKNNLSNALLNHYNSPGGEITKRKLKRRSEKWAPIIGKINKEKWNNEEWVAQEMNRRHSDGQYLRSSHTNKQLYSTPDFREKFLRAVNREDRVVKISSHSKKMWQSPEYVKKVLGQARNKGMLVNGYRMNMPESVIANILNEFNIKWKYEEIVKIDKKTYIPDFLINDDTIVEVFGDFWHANPLIYSENDIVYSNISAKQIWERDLLKKTTLENAGYKVYIIWQDEINTDYEKVKEIINEIC